MSSGEEKKIANVLDYCGLQPSDISLDYVNTKKQFQLHTLITEQRHEKTFNLSQLARDDVPEALAAIFSVDEDITRKLTEIAEDPKLAEAVQAMKRAMKAGRKIYYYGCGATGRLAKQMESSFWRPFWERMNKKFPDRFSSLLDIVIGEMTGADKALISSLEGLEDLQLIGKLQLEDHGVRKGDVVFCITEGGETSSVIGTILTARRQYEEKDTEASKRNLFFIFNNPEEVLQHLDRSMEVLNNPGITKIPLWTGPQAVSGSTRMQATTSETFLAGVIMEQAIYEYLQDCEMTPSQLNDLGFEDGLTLKDRVLSFAGVQKASQATARDLAKLTDWEADTYAKGGNATYWSDTGMVTVFTDSTERSPTFGLHPLDTVDAKEKKCWIKVVTSSKDQKSAWKYFLRRDFKGLESARYKRSFQNDIEDHYLREAALTSLKHAGSEQVALYDFSCKDVHLEPPKAHDLGLVCLLNDDEFSRQHQSFLDSYSTSGKSCVILTCSSMEDKRIGEASKYSTVPVVSDTFKMDPLQVRQHMAMKVILNAHSTCIMGRLGRLVGNTMTNVSPSNLKLIGRATYLILLHVNAALEAKQLEVSYEACNAVLYDVLRWAQETGKEGSIAEVALTIVRIVEAIKKEGEVSWEEAEQIFHNNESNLETYLNSQD